MNRHRTVFRSRMALSVSLCLGASVLLMLLFALGAGWVAAANPQAVYAPAETPPIPANLTVVSVTQTTTTLTWTLAMDANDVVYRLYERISPNPLFSYWLLRLDNIPATTVTVDGLAPGTTHKYAVAAVDATSAESPKSLLVTLTTLRPPLAYNNGGPTYAIVGQPFTYNVDAIGVPPPTFTLASGPDAMQVDAVSGVVNWLPATGDVGDATFTVRAVNSEGSDDHTATIPVYAEGTDLQPPSPVTGLSATAVTTNSATLMWNPAQDNVGVTAYRIYAQQDSHGQTLVKIGEVADSTTTFVVTTLQPGTGYRLWVAAVDAAGNEGSISGLSGIHITTLPAAPTVTPTPTSTVVETDPAETATPTNTATATSTPTPTPTSTSTNTPTPGHVALTIDPLSPSVADVISITVSGTYTSSCVPGYASHMVAGNEILLESSIPNQDFCLPAEFPWEYTVQVGPLAAGVYTVTHSLEGVIDQTHFTVRALDQPTPTPTPTATEPAPDDAMPPTILLDLAAIPPAAAGETFQYTVPAQGEPPPAFALLVAPPAMTIDTVSGLLTWQAPLDASGDVMVAVQATNSEGSDDITFAIHVDAAQNQPPLYLPFVSSSD